MAIVEITRPSAAPAPIAADPADWTKRIHPAAAIVAVILLVMPLLVNGFILFQIFSWSFILVMIGLSLMFLAGYGGMVSLAQMTIAGFSGYMVAIFGVSGVATISLGWPWWLAAPMALALATLFGTITGALAVRTEGIYTIMITLAIGVAFYYLTLQNYAVFNGFQGEQEVFPPTLAGIYWRDSKPFYYLTLACALVGYLFVVYLLRTPFGIALQGIRDNAPRMQALGFNVTAHRVAAYAVAGVLAAVGGVLFTWYNGLVTPGSVGTGWLINILVIAVLGGMGHPIGAFLGAIVFVLLQNFAIDVINRERFNLVIGVVFLVIVLFSRDGLLGWWAALRARMSTQRGGNPWTAARKRSYSRSSPSPSSPS
jgi:branched-chain amino acid transport system permease protein